MKKEGGLLSLPLYLTDDLFYRGAEGVSGSSLPDSSDRRTLAYRLRHPQIKNPRQKRPALKIPMEKIPTLNTPAEKIPIENNPAEKIPAENRPAEK